MRLGLALSGGGFRATLYHLGVVRFLRDSNLLPRVSHITSVSGGSVLAAHLVLNWDRYCGTPEEFDAVAQQILEFVSLDVRNRIVRRYPGLVGLGLARRLIGLRPSRQLTRTGLLERHYEKFLYGDACLHQLPATPEIHILSTNVSEGGLSSFSRDGLWIQTRATSGRPQVKPQRAGLAKVAMAVAASSAFPAFFPPLGLRAQDLGASEGEFSTQYFTDGGIYDNLGVRMFHFLGLEAKKSISRDDFLDIQAGFEAWNRCLQASDRTCLRRLAELASSRDGAGEASLGACLQQPQDLLAQLNLLIEKRHLSEDPELVELLGPSSGGDREAGDSSTSPEGELLSNRQVIAAAFRQAVGRDCLQLREGPCDVILASDAGKGFTVFGAERTPGFLSTALRSSDILMDRVWQLERDHFAHARQCVFAASSDLVPEESDPFALHPEIQVQVGRIRTDMDRFRETEISALVRHGYCVTRQACRSLPAPLSGQLAEGRPWDPTARLSGVGPGTDSAPDQRPVDNVAVAARILHRAARRRVWSSLLDVRDWVTWIYIPLIVLLFGVLPLFAYRMYRHARLDAALTRAVAEMREDFRRMLTLLEFGPAAEFAALPVQDVDVLAPRLAQGGLDIVSDTRITDLRQWLGDRSGEERRVIMYRHVLVRKLSEVAGITALRLQSIWDTPDLAVRCENARLEPVVRRCKSAGTADPNGPFTWEVCLDFSSVPVGETVELVVSVMQTARADDRRMARKEWWRFEVDAEPEIATSWVLLPDDHPHGNFSVVRARNETPEVIELVKPTHHTKMQGGAVITWSVVHPEPGYTYSSHWQSD